MVAQVNIIHQVNVLHKMLLKVDTHTEAAEQEEGARNAEGKQNISDLNDLLQVIVNTWMLGTAGPPTQAPAQVTLTSVLKCVVIVQFEVEGLLWTSWLSQCSLRDISLRYKKYRKALFTHSGVPMTSTIGVKEQIPCFIVRTIIFHT